MQHGVVEYVCQVVTTMVLAMTSSFSTRFHSQLTVVGVTRGVHLGYIHNIMAKYKLPHCMAVFPLHIEPTAYDHHYDSSSFVLLW